jgi:hypothetical protein
LYVRVNEASGRRACFGWALRAPEQSFVSGTGLWFVFKDGGLCRTNGAGPGGGRIGGSKKFGRTVGARAGWPQPGIDVMIFKIFSPKI